MREISEGEGTVRAIWRTLLSVNAFAYCATWGPEQRSREVPNLLAESNTVRACCPYQAE